jgi:hypothetical protein
MFWKIGLCVLVALVTLEPPVAFAQGDANGAAQHDKRIEAAVREFYVAHELNDIRTYGMVEKGIGVREDRVTVKMKDGTKRCGSIVGYACGGDTASVDSFVLVDASGRQAVVRFADVKEIDRESRPRHFLQGVGRRLKRRTDHVRQTVALPVYILSNGVIDLANVGEGWR